MNQTYPYFKKASSNTPWRSQQIIPFLKPIPMVNGIKITNVFVSHTKQDEKFCDIFDRACSRVGIKAFRSEFEEIELPAWRTIKDAINKSTAIFFLVGKELVKNQQFGDSNWKYTQNWIAYEIGVACQKGINVWAICDDVEINFPMPYIDNYLPMSISHKEVFDYFKHILMQYHNGYAFPVQFSSPACEGKGLQCPHNECKAEYNLHVSPQPDYAIVCPQCLQKIYFKKTINY